MERNQTEMNFRRITAAAMVVAVAAGLFSCGKKESSGYNYSDGLDENGFFKGVTATDYIELPEYKGIELDSSITVASEEDLQAQIDALVSATGSYEKIYDGAIEDGDTVNIDYVGSIDGVKFEGGDTKGQGTDVTIGVTRYIDDFLEQLIGHKPGENFDIEVTFPENYGKENLNGKDAIFNITINYIQGDGVLTDEVALNYGFNTVDDLVEDIEKYIISNQKLNMVTGILEKATVKKDIPQSVIDYIVNYDIEQQTLYASYYYGVTLEDMLKQKGFDSKQAYIDAYIDTFKENATMYLAAQAIAETEGLRANKSDFETAGYTDEDIKTYGEPYLKQYVMISVLIPDFIIANADMK